MGFGLLATAFVYLRLVFCAKDHSYSEVGSSCSLWFIVAPKFLTKCSLLISLHWANPSRISSAFERREFLYFAQSIWACAEGLFLSCFCSQRRQSGNGNQDTDYTSDEVSEGDVEIFHHAVGSDDSPEIESQYCGSDDCKNHIAAMLVPILVCFSLLAMLVKMTSMFCETLIDYRSWTFHNWIIFFGFINQIGGIVLASEVELLRVLLFKFGGSEAKWDSQNVKRCNEFLKFLVLRVLDAVGADSIVALASMGSNTIQKVCVSKGVDKVHGHARKTREKIFTRCFASGMSSSECLDWLIKQGNSAQVSRPPRANTEDERLEMLAQLLSAASVEGFITDVQWAEKNDMIL